LDVNTDGCIGSVVDFFALGDGGVANASDSFLSNGCFNSVIDDFGGDYGSRLQFAATRHRSSWCAGDEPDLGTVTDADYFHYACFCI